MRRDLYASLGYGNDRKECDAGFDLYAALGSTADGEHPVGSGTTDGTHPGQTQQQAAAADLITKLPGLLGF